jgi:putative phosphoribosyl transferase
MRGTVAFAHGSGSSRRSSRNQFVAEVLRSAGLATLLLDLLTPDEEAYDDRTGQLRFDVDLLSQRLDAAVSWWRAEVGHGGLGLFGASTGAAAALISAARRPSDVDAVVSRGGRPDMASAALANVKAPTLLIVGSEDHKVMQLNRAAAASLTCPHELAVVPGATHLFEEPGALDHVAQLARAWFLTYLAPQRLDEA